MRVLQLGLELRTSGLLQECLSLLLKSLKDLIFTQEVKLLVAQSRFKGNEGSNESAAFILGIGNSHLNQPVHSTTFLLFFDTKARVFVGVCSR